MPKDNKICIKFDEKLFQQIEEFKDAEHYEFRNTAVRKLVRNALKMWKHQREGEAS